MEFPTNAQTASSASSAPSHLPPQLSPHGPWISSLALKTKWKEKQVQECLACIPPFVQPKSSELHVAPVAAIFFKKVTNRLLSESSEKLNKSTAPDIHLNP
jgi:hypothetical protein